MRGVLAGALALIVLHTLVAYRGPSARLEELAGSNGVLVGFARRFLDPTVPAIPDLRSSSEPGKVVGPVGAKPKPTYPTPNGD